MHESKTTKDIQPNRRRLQDTLNVRRIQLEIFPPLVAVARCRSHDRTSNPARKCDRGSDGMGVCSNNCNMDSGPGDMRTVLLPIENRIIHMGVPWTLSYKPVLSNKLQLQVAEVLSREPSFQPRTWLAALDNLAVWPTLSPPLDNSRCFTSGRYCHVNSHCTQVSWKLTMVTVRIAVNLITAIGHVNMGSQSSVFHVIVKATRPAIVHQSCVRGTAKKGRHP